MAVDMAKAFDTLSNNLLDKVHILLFYKNSDKVNFSFNQKFENLFQYEIASITNRTGNDCKI